MLIDRRVLAMVCVLAAAALSPALVGCQVAPRSDRFQAPAGGYEQAFDAVKDVLREHRFELERVDARRGVITTRPRASSGWATPWIRHASDAELATRGLLQRERRTVRVTFDAVAAAAPAVRPQAPTPTPTPALADPLLDQADPADRVSPRPPTGDADLRAHAGPIEARVEVFIERVYSPNRRLESTSVRLTSEASDPRDAAAGRSAERLAPAGRDEALAGRLAREAAARAAGAYAEPRRPDQAGGAAGPR